MNPTANFEISKFKFRRTEPTQNDDGLSAINFRLARRYLLACSYCASPGGGSSSILLGVGSGRLTLRANMTQSQLANAEHLAT